MSRVLIAIGFDVRLARGLLGATKKGDTTVPPLTWKLRIDQLFAEHCF